MKNPFNAITQKLVKTTSMEVKKEVKKTAIDLLPGLISIAGIILGVVIFHSIPDDSGDEDTLTPSHVSTTITNNYFFQDLSEDVIKKIIDND